MLDSKFWALNQCGRMSPIIQVWDDAGSNTNFPVQCLGFYQINLVFQPQTLRNNHPCLSSVEILLINKYSLVESDITYLRSFLPHTWKCWPLEILLNLKTCRIVETQHANLLHAFCYLNLSPWKHNFSIRHYEHTLVLCRSVEVEMGTVGCHRNVRNKVVKYQSPVKQTNKTLVYLY